MSLREHFVGMRRCLRVILIVAVSTVLIQLLLLTVSKELRILKSESLSKRIQKSLPSWNLLHDEVQDSR